MITKLDPSLDNPNQYQSRINYRDLAENIRNGKDGEVLLLPAKNRFLVQSIKRQLTKRGLKCGVNYVVRYVTNQESESGEIRVKIIN